MHIILLIWAILTLYSNIRGYKNLFKSNLQISNELAASLIENEERLGEKFKPTMYTLYLSIVAFSSLFWIVLAVTVGNVIVTLIASLLVATYIVSCFKLPKLIETKRLAKKGCWRYITAPVITVLIIIYIVVLLGKF